ncbi:thiol:disulfide interchange protein DsbA/DsbL [Vibrio sp. SCSIO 43136]|uniref:thiol:disulfide interchange protein DsbA/DsbL n=1 Tax=Vibrio sp. SCSIO 43136 TaxID=2819101 RepID=UPI002074AE2F|nr:thiol:disulfide interchange protein DsbA/DsbL [Vibrio sp. SCSIO 43136]USD67939.1 thiol:disulfide interchange protein DsbA/DsbL [Vibrio sp. SCSIO 43136]
MKKLFTLFAGLMLAVSAHAAKFNEGDHYQVLNGPKSSKPIVTEYFSFYCPHCKDFEPIFAQLKTKLDPNVKVQKVHPSFMGGSMGLPMSKAYATMVALKVEDKMIPVMFRQIHDYKQPPKDEAAIRQLFIDNGIDGKKFDGAYKGFNVDSMQKRFDKAFQSAGLRGVPSVIVNDKYLVVTNNIQSLDQYFELVTYLTKM